MGKSKPKKMNPKEFVEEPRGHALRHILLTVVMLVVIAYVALLLISRTDGFRSYVESWLEDRIGMDIVLENVAVTPGLDLVLRRLETEGGLVAGEPGLYLEELKVDFSLLQIFRGIEAAVDGIRLQDPYISFKLSKDGTWQPGSLSLLGEKLAQWISLDLPEAEAEGGEEAGSDGDALQQAVVGFSDEISLTIHDGRVVWWNPRGAQVGEAEGIDLEVMPVPLKRRKMAYYFVSVRTVRAQGRDAREFAIEMLRVGEQNIVLFMSGDLKAPTFSSRAQPPVSKPIAEAVPTGPGASADSIRAELERAAE